jgi:hypothetical protein
VQAVVVQRDRQIMNNTDLAHAQKKIKVVSGPIQAMPPDFFRGVRTEH